MGPKKALKNLSTTSRANANTVPSDHSAMADNHATHVTGDANGSPTSNPKPRVKPQQRGRPLHRTNHNAVAIPVSLQKSSPSAPTPLKHTNNVYPSDPPPPTPSSEEIININARDGQPSSGLPHTVRRLTDLEVSSKSASLCSGTSTLVFSPSNDPSRVQYGAVCTVRGLAGGLWEIHESLLNRKATTQCEDGAFYMPMKMSPLWLNHSPWVVSALDVDATKDDAGFNPDDGTGFPDVDAGYGDEALSDSRSGPQQAGPGSGTSFIDGTMGWAVHGQESSALGSARSDKHNDPTLSNGTMTGLTSSPPLLDLQQLTAEPTKLLHEALSTSTQAAFNQLEAQLTNPSIDISTITVLLQSPSLTQAQLIHLLGRIRALLLDTLYQIRTLELQSARLLYFGPKYTHQVEKVGKDHGGVAKVEFYDSMDEDFVAEQVRLGGDFDVKGVILRHAVSFRAAVGSLAELGAHVQHTGSDAPVEPREETTKATKRKQTRGGKNGKKQKGAKLGGLEKTDAAGVDVAAPEKGQDHLEMHAQVEKKELSVPASVGGMLRQGKRGVSVPSLV